MSWTIERRGRVAVVTMTTNPVNAQNQAFFADLHDAFDRLERDHRDSPVVLTGTGRRFSAGLDLDEHFRLFAGDPAAVGSWFAGYRATNMRLFTYPRPTVAAINGHAFAGGLITAAVCDHRIAVTGDASFGLNEVPIGIPMPAVYVRMLTLEGVERLVQISEERTVLRVDLVGVHSHHGHPTPPLDRPTDPRLSVHADTCQACRRRSKPPAAGRSSLLHRRRSGRGSVRGRKWSVFVRGELLRAGFDRAVVKALAGCSPGACSPVMDHSASAGV